MTKETAIANCYVSPSLSNEQYIQSHTFFYLVSGTMTVYDGSREYKLKQGDYAIGKRNHLAKYTKHPENGAFKKIYISFEQDFLKAFNETYKYIPATNSRTDTIILFPENKRIDHFIQSVIPYFNERGIIDEDFLDIKRSELLLLLLKADPGLAAVFFDFSHPEKINLEEFMNRNFRFNVRIERFAYLTGRSLSAFKRDFEKIFHVSPGHWLVQKRLEEAHYLISKENKKPSEIYLEVGFEDLSHFSFAFKKLYGHSPGQLTSKD